MWWQICGGAKTQHQKTTTPLNLCGVARTILQGIADTIVVDVNKNIILYFIKVKINPPSAFGEQPRQKVSENFTNRFLGQYQTPDVPLWSLKIDQQSCLGLL